jgi:hypothetical protein
MDLFARPKTRKTTVMELKATKTTCHDSMLVISAFPSPELPDAWEILVGGSVDGLLLGTFNGKSLARESLSEAPLFW